MDIIYIERIFIRILNHLGGIEVPAAYELKIGIYSERNSEVGRVSGTISEDKTSPNLFKRYPRLGEKASARLSQVWNHK